MTITQHYEDEQYALVYYLEHGNPGPVLREISEQRIRDLECNKNLTKPIKYYPVKSSYPNLVIDKTPTVGDCKI